MQQYRGERLVAHAGGLSGQIAQSALLPRNGVGVAIFSNVENDRVPAIRMKPLSPLADFSHDFRHPRLTRVP